MNRIFKTISTKKVKNSLVATFDALRISRGVIIVVSMS